MKSIYFTQCGRKHPVNQDGVFICGYTARHTRSPQKLLLPNGHGLFMVLDGMGGPEGGHVATDLFLKSVAHAHVPEAPDCVAIRHLLYQATHRLRHEARQRAGLEEMGAVCAGVWFIGVSAFYFNCGDCRVYLNCNGQLNRLTRDHTAAQALLDKGAIDEDEIRFLPDRNLLLTAVSAKPCKPEIYCETVNVRNGGHFLLCSDGVWSMFSFKEIEEITSQDINRGAAILAQKAGDCDDDYSFVLIECDPEEQRS